MTIIRKTTARRIVRWDQGQYAIESWSPFLQRWVTQHLCQSEEEALRQWHSY